jgi:ornithine--oxo-acid transaminase
MTAPARLQSPQSTQAYIEIEDRYGAHNYHPLDLVVREAKGAWVTDVEGNRYLDGLSAYSALNQGHCHPRLVARLKEQAEKVTLTSRAFRNDQLPLLCQELAELAGLETVLPMNSGAEAVETAVKMARKWGYQKKGIPVGQAEIVVCRNNFHGRTVTIVSFSTDEDYREGFGPFTPGFKVAEYGDLASLASVITPNTCAVLVEPMQGEAGIIIPPKGYLKGIAEICAKQNVLFIADEIQTGFGRTGKLFAFQHEGVQPDAIIVGKALSGGFYPVSAVIARRDVMDVFQPGQHGSTFGGNPLACAVAREALQIIIDEQLAERSARLGAQFLARLQAVQSPHIKEVRGAGLWIGIELNVKARPFCEALMRLGVLCKETHDNVIRFAPPLVTEEADLDWAFVRLEKVLSAADPKTVMSV